MKRLRGPQWEGAEDNAKLRKRFAELGRKKKTRSCIMLLILSTIHKEDVWKANSHTSTDRITKVHSRFITELLCKKIDKINISVNKRWLCKLFGTPSPCVEFLWQLSQNIQVLSASLYVSFVINMDLIRQIKRRFFFPVLNLLVYFDIIQ